MDLQKKELSSEEETNGGNKKYCADCKTTKTPLWRGGPAGPKSLCNACGIRYRKKRRALVGMNKTSQRKKERAHYSHGSISSNSTSTASNTAENSANGGSDVRESLKIRLMALGKDLLLQRLSSSVKKQRCQRRKKLGEEEQAAVSLLALSSGSVFA